MPHFDDLPLDAEIKFKLPDAMKLAFQQACMARRTDMSEVLRAAISLYIASE